MPRTTDEFAGKYVIVISFEKSVTGEKVAKFFQSKGAELVEVVDTFERLVKLLIGAELYKRQIIFCIDLVLGRDFAKTNPSPVGCCLWLILAALQAKGVSPSQHRFVFTGLGDRRWAEGKLQTMVRMSEQPLRTISRVRYTYYCKLKRDNPSVMRIWEDCLSTLDAIDL